MKRKPIAFKPPGADYEIRVVGDRATPLRDFYHALLHLPWWATIAAISRGVPGHERAVRGGFVAIGGVATRRRSRSATRSSSACRRWGRSATARCIRSRRRRTSWSSPSRSPSLLLTALVDRAGVREVLAPDGAVRVHAPGGDLADERRADVDVPPRQRARQPDRQRADPRSCMVRTERTSEGETFYRMLDLKPTRERALSLSRSWNVLHDDRRAEPARRRDAGVRGEKEVELQVMVIGTRRHLHADRARRLTATSRRTSCGARAWPTS